MIHCSKLFCANRQIVLLGHWQINMVDSVKKYISKYIIFSESFASQGGHNKDHTVWLDLAKDTFASKQKLKLLD
jgi:hypothetical protein